LIPAEGLTAEEVLILGGGGVLSEEDLTGISAGNIICPLWYDWSVSSKYLYTNSWTTAFYEVGVPSSVPPDLSPPSDGDGILITLNKSWILQGYPSTALGSSMGHSANDMYFKTGGDNGKSYAKITDSSQFYVRSNNGGGPHGAGDNGLYPNAPIWPRPSYVYTGGSEVYHSPLCSADLEMNNFTIFIVANYNKSNAGLAIKLVADNADSSAQRQVLLYRKYFPGQGIKWGMQFAEELYSSGGVTHEINSGTFTGYQEAHVVTAVGDGAGSSMLYMNGDTSDGVDDGDGPTYSLEYSADVVRTGVVIGNDQRLQTTGTTDVGTNNWAWGSNSKMYEIIIYNQVLTSGQRSNIETHLKSKYGIT
jgi:hypothetical protein